MLLLVLGGDQLWLYQEGRRFGGGGGANDNLMLIVNGMQEDPGLLGGLRGLG